MCMNIKIEILLENGDLTTLIKIFATLFSKIDLSTLEPKIVINPEYGETNTDRPPTDDIYYNNGSGEQLIVDNEEKKNEKI